MPSTHFSRRASDVVDSRWIDWSRLRAISGMRTLSSNWPCMPPIVIAVSLPIDLRGDLQDDLGDDRVDLAGHDRRALLQLGQEQLADAGARAGAHQREVVGDLGQRDGDDLQRAGQLDERVAVGLRLERVLGRADLEAGGLGQQRAHALGELGVRVQAGAGRGAAERDLRDVRQRVARRARRRGGSARRSRRTPGRA